MKRWKTVFAAAVWASLASGQTSSGVAGRVVDPSGATVPNAALTLTLKSSGSQLRTSTAADGAFAFPHAGRGTYELRVSAEGFTEVKRSLNVPAAGVTGLDIHVEPATIAEQVVVHANEVVGPEAALRDIPGAVSVIDPATLTQSRVFTSDEALRKVPGVYTRGEEGFGLRPNIGIRGLNPTRSSKVLLLEDGIPISYAPYGDNASYYHPPVDRFETIEVVKGSGQILYGPSTVGGVINYLTPAAPDRSSGSVTLTGGNRDYLNAHARWGTTIGRTGVLLDYMRKQGDGTRENTHFGLNDVTGKVLRSLTSRQTLSVKANYYGEDSQLTYSGLRQDEFLANPRGNPFRNDALDFNRAGAAVSHTYALTPSLVLTSNAYVQRFQRDWWRQSSNSAQRPNDAADPACVGMTNLDITCGNEGRLRRYTSWGIEPRLRAGHTLFGVRNEMDFGFRAHFEDQNRRQENGDFPAARSGVLVERNQRENQAYSGFLQNRFAAGKWGFTLGLRLEHVRMTRTNLLLNVRGNTALTQWIPGLGVSYSPNGATTIYTGLHRGFSPPRTEDVISNTTGGIIDLDPEMSWNYELGVRSRVGRSAAFEATFFRMDFENQIIPASVAGGTGATLTSGGHTLHQGAEFSGRFDYRNIAGSRSSGYFKAAYTWVPVADFRGSRFSNISAFSRTPVTGNRIPYAPEYMLNTTVGYLHASGFNALVEGVFTGGQFADDLNTWAPSPDGQRGRVPGNTLWNATANYPIESLHTTLFATVKNAADRLYIVDRSRGVLPGMPRLVQIGMRFGF